MKVDKLVPEVYYKESRDFSYIGRLFEIVFNYMRMGGSLVNVNLDDKYINSTILDLGALTLGFESKHKYVTKDLLYVISCFTNLLKNKGTMPAVKTVVQLLCTSQKFSIDIDSAVMRDQNDHWKLLIYLPEGLKDVILMEDLFDYILPTGMIYEISFIGAQQKQNVTEITEDSLQPTRTQEVHDPVVGSVYDGDSSTQDDILRGVVVSSL